MVDHRGRGGDQFDVIFALDPVADHFEVQQPKEPAAEAEAQRGGGFHFKAERRVIEREFVDGVAHVLELGGVHGEQPTEHHRLCGFEARQRLDRFAFVGDGVADAGVAHLFDGGGQKPDFAGPKAVDHLHLRAEHPDAVHVVRGAVGDEFDLVALFQAPSMMRTRTMTPR